MSISRGSHIRALLRRRLSSAPAAALIFVGVLGRGRLALADESASERATARSLANEGYVALKSKDFGTAEDRFRRADELVHAPTLVVDHARALVGLGRVGEAYEAYQSVVEEEVPANAPGVWKVAVKNARRELEALRPHVAWLTVTVKGPIEPRVEVDGRSLPPSGLGVRRPVSPGHREIQVSAEGFITKTTQIELTEGAEQELELEPEPLPKPAPVIVVAPPVINHVEREAERKNKRNRQLAYVSFGVAGVGLATGAAAGILWLGARHDVNADCGGLECHARTDSEQTRFTADKRRYDTFGTISGIAFGAGLAGAATGVALLLFEPKPNVDGPPKAASIKPYCAPTSIGVLGTF